MLTDVPPPFRKRRPGPKKAASAPPAPVALTLVSASYDPGGPGPALLTLVFDRAVDIAAYEGFAIRVDDNVFNNIEYNGTGGASLVGPATVRITLVDTGIEGAGPPTLNANDNTGIVADNDGGTWGGVNDLELPFP